MSQKQLEAHHVLRTVLEDKLTLKQVSQALDYSYRHCKRLKARVEEHGARGLIHGNRNRPPANKVGQEVREEVLASSRD